MLTELQSFKLVIVRYPCGAVQHLISRGGRIMFLFTDFGYQGGVEGHGVEIS